ncbi:MAG: hypothetical protein WBK95_03675 [Sulfurimonas sp.]|jgi:hypothetical protein|nr:hypothetical protein [Sulfurimonas sp.]MDD3060040.1 hypothetical protein [Sulfurimonas sp.]
MENEELYDTIDNSQSLTQRYLGVPIAKFLLMFFMVIGFGVYLGMLLYGTNSLEVLFGLQDYETYLQGEVDRLKNENAELQREYFELKEISAQ